MVQETRDNPLPETENSDKTGDPISRERAVPQPDVSSPPSGKSGTFRVHDIDLSIPRGQLVAIVGPVGSGKSSLLQGLVGDMKRLSGSVTFGGSVGYCAQTSWIQASPYILVQNRGLITLNLECLHS